MAKQTLESWINEAMTDSEKEAIRGFTLMHMVGQAEREIHTTKFGTKQWTPKDLAGLFRHKAESYCQEIQGTQSFVLLAFYGEDEEPQARHPFLVSGELDLHGLSTESPDEKGFRMQGMRHIEAITQLNHRALAHVLDTMSSLNQSLMRENLEVRKENREGFALMKDLIATQALNKHEYAMKEREYERSSAERSKWLGFLPALANTVLGAEIFPQSTEDTALLESIADSLSEEDLIKLSSVLKPEILGPISSRFEKYFKTKHLKAATASKLLKSKDPEDDAAGD